MRIGSRILLGFSLSVVFILAVSIAGMSSLRDVSGAVKAIDQYLFPRVLGLAELERQTFESVVAAREAIARMDQAAAARLPEGIARINQVFDGGLKLANAHGDAAASAKLAEARKQADDYAAQVQRIDDVIGEAHQISAAFEKAGAEVVALAQDYGNAAEVAIYELIVEGDVGALTQRFIDLRQAKQAERLLMTARLDEMRFRVGHDKGVFVALLKDVDELVALLGRMSDEQKDTKLKALVDKMRDAVGRYRAAAESWSKKDAELAEIVARMGAQERAMIGAAQAAAQEAGQRARANSSNAVAQSADTQTVILAVSAVSTVLLLVFSFLVSRTITPPIIRMTATMTTLADGRLDVEVPGLERKDEIGQMAKSVLIFRDSLAKVQALQAEQEQAKQRAEGERRQALRSLADGFESSVKEVVDGVAAAAGNMDQVAARVASVAERAAGQAGQVAEASELASKNVQSVAQGAGALSESIARIGQQVRRSSEIAQSAVREADRTDAMVRGLSEAADKINEVINLITEIASQTNLLALNATIEAARAGEAGKGFAVVAGEVKNLANQTANASEEIVRQVGTIRDATAGAVEAIHRISSTIDQMNAIASEIASAVAQQGSATQAIAAGTGEAATGTRQVSSGIAEVNRATGDVGAGASEVVQAAGALNRLAESLRQAVDSFLASVRKG